MAPAASGRLGEDLALRFLEACGFTCRARRWRRGGGELDLVLARGDLLVFCEVKTRGPGSLARAAEAVDRRQLRRVRMLARRWCWEHGVTPRRVRVDVITVDLGGEGRGVLLRHFPDAG